MFLSLSVMSSFSAESCISTRAWCLLIGQIYLNKPAVNTFGGQPHCVKSVRIRNFSGLNVEKYGPEKLRMRTLSTQCLLVDT